MSTSLQSPWRRPLAGGLGVLACTAAFGSSGQTAVPSEVARIELPGVGGRLDHLAIDREGQRLFVAALGADKVEVIDLRAGRRIAELGGVREPQGVTYMPAARRLLVAGGESEAVVAFEQGGKTATADGMPDADNMRLSVSADQLFVGFGSGLAVIDPATLAVVRRIALPGHPEAFEIAERGPEIYVNVPEVGRIVVVDRGTGKITAQWSITPETANFPMALDEAAHRLYVGTRRPARLLAYDTSNGRRVFEIPLCGDVDDLFFDAVRAQLLAVCGDGEVDVIALQGDAGAKPATRLETVPGTRTGLFEPSSRTLFIAAPKRLGMSAEVRIYHLP